MSVRCLSYINEAVGSPSFLSLLALPIMSWTVISVGSIVRLSVKIKLDIPSWAMVPVIDEISTILERSIVGSRNFLNESSPLSRNRSSLAVDRCTRGLQCIITWLCPYLLVIVASVKPSSDFQYVGVMLSPCWYLVKQSCAN